MASENTVADIADWLGISSRRVAELQAEGTIPKGDTKAAVRAYCAHIRPSAGRAAAGGSDAAPDLDTARVRLLTAQADAREMLNSQMRAETMTSSDVEAVVGAVVEGVRAKSLALPTRAAPLLAGMANMAEIRDILTGLVHETLTELASAEIVAKVADRARSRAGRVHDVDPNTPPAGTAA
jgi:phage terminase Nu1 subunit (DNA packaging protein)